MRERLFEALRKLQSVDNAQRKEAEKEIMGWADTRFKELAGLLLEMLIEAKVLDGAITAGMVLKMFFVWESASKREAVNQRWMQLAEADREALKQKMVLGLSVCQPPLGDVLAQCLSVVARLEVVNGRWNSVFLDLAEIAGKAATETAQQNVIKTIGNLCVDTTGMDSSIIAGSSGSILTVIISNAKAESPTTRLCAFECLHQSMGFIAHNMQLADESLAIMKAVYEGCQSPQTEVACRALDCLVAALGLYPEATLKYVAMGFGDITIEYLRSEEEAKILGAIEAWGLIASLEAGETSGQLAAKAFPVIAGEMLSLLQLGNLERVEEWAPYKAAAWLLGVLAEHLPAAVAGSVVSKALGKPVPLATAVSDLLGADKLSAYEAGAAALGALLNEETAELLPELVQKSLPLMTNALSSGELTVIETTLWTFEKVFKHAYPAVRASGLEGPIIEYGVSLAKNPSEVAVSAAWSLAGIVAAVQAANADAVASGDWSSPVDLEQAITLLMSRFVHLLEHEYSLRVALASSISELVKLGATSHRKAVTVMAHDVIAHIKRELSSGQTSEEHIYCQLTILQACLRAHDGGELAVAGEVVEIVCFILGNASLLGLYTDAYLTLDALADVLGLAFGNYSDRVNELVLRDLARLGTNLSHEEGFTAFATSLLGFVGTMASATKLGFNVYVDEFVPLIIYATSTPYLTKEAQIAALNTFADISLSVGKIFDKYLEAMFGITTSAIQIKDDGSDPGFVFALREALLDLLSCVVQSSNGKSKTVADNVAVVLKVIKVVAEETNDAECAIKALYLLSDLWALYGNDPAYPHTSGHLNAQWIVEFISAKLNSTNRAVKEAAVATRYQIGSFSLE